MPPTHGGRYVPSRGLYADDCNIFDGSSRLRLKVASFLRGSALLWQRPETVAAHSRDGRPSASVSADPPSAAQHWECFEVYFAECKRKALRESHTWCRRTCAGGQGLQLLDATCGGQSGHRRWDEVSKEVATGFTKVVSRVSRAGREDSKLVGIVRELQSESGRWAGCLRGLETRCPQAAADSIRHETLMAELQEAVPCGARSPYSMPLRSPLRCSGKISAQSLVQCSGVAEEAPLRHRRWQEQFPSRGCGSEECRALVREDGEAGECWRWHRAMSSVALHNALKCGSITRAAGATRRWFGTLTGTISGGMTLEMSSATSNDRPRGLLTRGICVAARCCDILGVESDGERLRARAASGTYQKLRLTLQRILEKR